MRKKIISHIYTQGSDITTSILINVLVVGLIPVGLLLYFNYLKGGDYEGATFPYFVILIYLIFKKLQFKSRISILNRIRKIEYLDDGYLKENFKIGLNDRIFKYLGIGSLSSLNQYETFYKSILFPYYNRIEDKNIILDNQVCKSDVFEFVAKVPFTMNVRYINGHYYDTGGSSIAWRLSGALQYRDTNFIETLCKVFQKKIPLLYLAKNLNNEKYILISECEFGLYNKLS